MFNRNNGHNGYNEMKGLPFEAHGNAVLDGLLSLRGRQLRGEGRLSPNARKALRALRNQISAEFGGDLEQGKGSGGYETKAEEEAMRAASRPARYYHIREAQMAEFFRERGVDSYVPDHDGQVHITQPAYGRPYVGVTRRDRVKEQGY